MEHTHLQLPSRSVKPRQAGLTMVIDKGLPLRYFADLIRSASDYVDFVKFGWGTSVVSIDRKSTRLNSSHLVISYAVFCLKKTNKIVEGRSGELDEMGVRVGASRLLLS